MTTAAVDTGPISALIGAPAGEVAGLFAGVSASCLSSSAACPIVVVRGPHDAGPVVVGVDGSPLSEEVLAWAFEEAANRKVPLVALHAWHDGDVAGLFTGEVHCLFPANLCGRTKIAPWGSGSPSRRVSGHDRPRDALTRSVTAPCGAPADPPPRVTMSISPCDRIPSPRTRRCQPSWCGIADVHEPSGDRGRDPKVPSRGVLGPW